MISIDTWQGTPGPDEALHRQIMAEHHCEDMFGVHAENMRRLGLAPWSKRLRGKTVPDGVEWLREWGYRPGLVFIDADHAYDAVKADCDAWAAELLSGGFLAFHDDWMPGPARVISELRGFEPMLKAADLSAFRKA